MAVKNIAKNCDMFFVIGSRNSSNSVRLVEVAKKSGCENSMLIIQKVKYLMIKLKIQIQLVFHQELQLLKY
jgi:4-hydroxy-3-methylbut-2-enyl diphosphate reductase IspH